jgi:hypothetical protein
VQRVALLLNEIPMNRLRPTISLAAIAVLLTGTVRMASGWFPLTGSALFVREETDDEEIESQEANKRLGSKVLESKLIHRVDPEYPELAGRARVEGEVTLKISVNEEGDVSNVEVISGHQLLRQAAVDAVKQWR